MKKVFKHRKTARRIRKLLLHGTCPLCGSSPPRKNCFVCRGSEIYGKPLNADARARWAERYITYRWEHV